jgi:hypothetical protein
MFFRRVNDNNDHWSRNMAARNMYLPMSLLEKLINGREYGVLVQAGRNNNRLMMHQEPVAYRYFSENNISYILHHLSRSFGQKIEFCDVQEIMVNLFHSMVSSKAHFVDPGKETAVRLALKRANDATIMEFRRRAGANHNLHANYQTVLDKPNRVPQLPQMASRWTSTQQHPHYGKDVRPDQLPPALDMDDDLGMHTAPVGDFDGPAVRRTA